MGNPKQAHEVLLTQVMEICFVRVLLKRLFNVLKVVFQFTRAEVEHSLCIRCILTGLIKGSNNLQCLDD